MKKHVPHREAKKATFRLAKISHSLTKDEAQKRKNERKEKRKDEREKERKIG